MFRREQVLSLDRLSQRARTRRGRRTTQHNTTQPYHWCWSLDTVGRCKAVLGAPLLCIVSLGLAAQHAGCPLATALGHDSLDARDCRCLPLTSSCAPSGADAEWSASNGRRSLIACVEWATQRGPRPLCGLLVHAIGRLPNGGCTVPFPTTARVLPILQPATVEGESAAASSHLISSHLISAHLGSS